MLVFQFHNAIQSPKTSRLVTEVARQLVLYLKKGDL